MVKLDEFIEDLKPHWEEWTVVMQAQLVSQAVKYSISPSPWPVSGCYQMTNCSTRFTGDNAERRSQTWQRQHSKPGLGDLRLRSIKGKCSSVTADNLSNQSHFYGFLGLWWCNLLHPWSENDTEIPSLSNLSSRFTSQSEIPDEFAITVRTSNLNLPCVSYNFDIPNLTFDILLPFWTFKIVPRVLDILSILFSVPYVQ